MPPSELLWLITSALLATCAFGFALVAWRREGTANIIHATPPFTAREVVEQHRFATIGATGFGAPIELYGTLEADETLLYLLGGLSGGAAVVGLLFGLGVV